MPYREIADDLLRPCLEVHFLQSGFDEKALNSAPIFRSFVQWRTTVSGVTINRACFQPDQRRRARIQNVLSSTRSLGLGCLRFHTVSCCRSARFSKSRFWRERKTRMSAPNESQNHRNMARVIAGKRCEEISQAVDFTAGQSFGETQVRQQIVHLCSC